MKIITLSGRMAELKLSTKRLLEFDEDDRWECLALAIHAIAGCFNVRTES